MGEFKYFKIEDFNCQETGDNEMDVEFIHKLDQLRRKQELMPKELQRTLKLVVGIKDTRSWNKLFNTDLQGLESLVLSSMWIAGLSELVRLL